MKAVTVLVSLLGLVGCAHTMEVRLPPPDARACRPSEHRIGVGALTVAEPSGQEDSACLRRRRYAQPGFATQLRSTLVADLAATGCFKEVVDLVASPEAEVDYVFSGNVAHFEACTREATDGRGQVSIALATGLFGVGVGGIVAADLDKEAGWAELGVDQIELHSKREARVIWRAGFARGSSRVMGKSRDVSPEGLGDEALGALARDLSRKFARVIGGDSPYGMISMESGQPDGPPEIALVSGAGPNEAEAFATVPAELARQLRPGYPALWPADRFIAREPRPEGTIAVVGLFANTDDAVDWLMTRNPKVKGLRMLQVHSAATAAEGADAP